MSRQKIEDEPNHDASISLHSFEHNWLLIFQKYDADNDGKISIRELYNQVNDPHFIYDIPERGVENILRQFDVNSDGFIDFDEFVTLMESDIGKQLIIRTLNSYIKHTVVARKRRIQTHPEFTGGEYEDEYTCSPPPFCMLLISALEVTCFLYDLSASLMNLRGKYSGFIDTSFSFGPAAELTFYTPSKRSEIWRFVTYMFVHANFFHLFFNVIVQIMLGIPLEMVHRWWRVFIIYLAGVLAGSLGTSVFNPETSLVGASGGVYAIITAHLSTIILIGYQAHLAGAVAGLLLGIYVLRNLEVYSWEKILKWICFTLYIILTVLAILYNIIFS
ncbi:rhomboid-related protein 3-like [Lycorma delicatula]|uniref:rhomboid-related protein 3-like n=1 Tax=Lycorma delicatula TaxID=130591 RepID=UPI003F50E4D3